MNPVTCICLFYQNFEDEKTVSQIGGASEVCDQNGDRVFIFYIFFIKLIEDADDDRICLSSISQWIKLLRIQVPTRHSSMRGIAQGQVQNQVVVE